MAPKEAPPAAPRSPQHASEVHEGRQHRQPEAAAADTAAPETPAGLVLSSSVVSKGDVSKCLREVETINDYFHQAAIRGSKDQALPTMSRVLDGLAQANGLNMLHPEDRLKLRDFLSRLKAQAPVVHMSFPSEASDSFIARILDWFRSQVHPHIVLHIGLQPELAAGCVVRTTNKLFDFSFRKRFEKSKQKLMAALEALEDAPDTAKIAEANATGQPTAMTAEGTHE